jgi:hypothetical protein
MKCHETGCDEEARVALRTTRPQRDNVKTVIFWDNRAEAVPKQAEHLCTKHALGIIEELARVLT